MGHIRTILTIIMLLNVIVFPGFLTGKIAPHAFLLVFLASFLAHFFFFVDKESIVCTGPRGFRQLAFTSVNTIM